MIREADAVVIGSGALGASAAYHLARAGRRVALVERHELVSQTSPRAAGLTAQMRGHGTMTRLAMLSVRQIERFGEETGEPLDFQQSGSLKIARTPADAGRVRADADAARALGLEVELLSPEAAARLSPFLRPVGIETVAHIPSDLYLEPGQLPRAYLRAAERLGASLLPRTSVEGIVSRNGAVERVVTDRGEIAAPVVVDAAGAWTRLVGELADLRIPLVPTRHQLLITQPIAGVRPEQPIIRIVDVNVYVRPCDGGLMLGGYERDPVQYDMRRLPKRFQIAELPLDFAVLRGLAGSVLDQLPVFREIEVREHRGGLPTMTADGHPLVGPMPGVEGFYVASGCCVGGLSISPAVGSVLADWIVAGRPAFELSILAPDRFGARAGSEEWLRAECRREYAYHYSAR